MKCINLVNGGTTFVDDEDYERANRFNWYLRDGYVARQVSGKPSVIWLHRWLMGAEKGQYVDHKNRNKLDNQRLTNLRFATRAQNARNAKPQLRKGVPFKGIHWHPRRVWLASIMHEGRAVNLGVYTLPEDGACAYDVAAKKLFGKFAYLNFPERTAPDWILEKVEKHLSKRNLGRRAASYLREKRTGCASHFKGVTQRRGSKKWIAQIRMDDHVKHLGYFVSEESAHKAYCSVKKRLLYLNENVPVTNS